MKVLELNQMELVNGGELDRRQKHNLCLAYSGVGLLTTTLGLTLSLVAGPVGWAVFGMAVAGMFASIGSFTTC